MPAVKKAAKKDAAKKDAAAERIEVLVPRFRQDVIPLVSISPLLCHHFPDETKREMVEERIRKDAGKKNPPKKKEALSIEEQFARACYPLDLEAPETDGRYGFPANAFRLACGTAGPQVGIPMTRARQMFLPLAAEIPLRCSMVKERIDNVGGRYGKPSAACVRAEFFDWSMDLPLEWDEDVTNLSSITSLLERAGRYIGVGAWRPERNGLHGRFRVATEE